MKKYIGIVLAVLMVFGLSGMAMASVGIWEPAWDEPGPLACHKLPSGVFGAYVKLDGGFHYSCNGQYRVKCSDHMTAVNVPFKVHASVAQWLKLDIDATIIRWRVVKPGSYSLRQAIHIDFQSNGDLDIHPYGFENLKSRFGEPDEIETFYRIVKVSSSWPAYLTAAAFNSTDFFVQEDQCHGLIRYKMDAKITVDECDSACEYVDPGGAGLKFILKEQKCWIRPYLG